MPVSLNVGDDVGQRVLANEFITFFPAQISSDRVTPLSLQLKSSIVLAFVDVLRENEHRLVVFLREKTYPQYLLCLRFFSVPMGMMEGPMNVG